MKNLICCLIFCVASFSFYSQAITVLAASDTDTTDDESDVELEFDLNNSKWPEIADTAVMQRFNLHSAHFEGLLGYQKNSEYFVIEIKKVYGINRQTGVPVVYESVVLECRNIQNNNEDDFSF